MTLRSLLATCAGLGLCVVSGAAPLPGKNLDFQAWTAEGHAEAWSVKLEPGFAVIRDCASAPWGLPCAVKVEGGKGAAGRQSLAQSTAPGASLGKRALLTGWIRTEGATEGASLWLGTVDSSGARIEVDDMATSRPVKGTIEWTRFSVQVPVAGNAHSLEYGVMLAGNGTAWFADLRLTSIDDAKAPSAPALTLPAHRKP